MVERARKPRKLRDIVEESQFWDAEDLIRNLDEEIERVEQGFGHFVWDVDAGLVTRCLRPLPMTPRFEVADEESDFKLKVNLPDVPEEHVNIDVDRDSVEVIACSDDRICRPYYIRVNSRGQLDPETARYTFTGQVLEVLVKKVKKKRIPVK